MSRREKMLASAVGLLVLVFIGLWVVDLIGGAMESRSDQILALEEEIRQKEVTKMKGGRAAERLAVYETRALPGDRERARSIYQSWLLQAVADADLEDIKVDPIAGRPVGEVYFVHPFNVSGRGNLEQLVEFLYGFYSKDILHRIERMTVAPIKDTRQLDITMTIEAVSLPSATHVDQLPSQPSSRLALGTLDKYSNPILKRNIFGPPNSSPRLESIGTRELEVQQSHTIQVRARDPDNNDQLRYWMEASEPLAARINEESGEITLSPAQLGEYTVNVGVKDNGLPEGSDEMSFTVNVVEPKPEPEPVAQEAPPSFDPASQAFVTGVVEVNGRPEIWVKVRTTGELLKLREGDRINIGQFDGVIKKIHPKAIAIQKGEEQVFLKQGQNLAQAAGLNADEI